MVASTVTYLIPVVAVALGALVLGEPVTWNLFAGGVLVLLGLAIAEGRLGMGRQWRPGPSESEPRSPPGLRVSGRSPDP